MTVVLLTNSAARQIRPKSTYERVGKTRAIRKVDMRMRLPFNVRVPAEDWNQLRDWCKAQGRGQQDTVEQWIIDDLVRRGFPLGDEEFVEPDTPEEAIRKTLPLAKIRRLDRQQLNVRLSRRVRRAIILYCRTVGMTYQSYMTDVLRSGIRQMSGFNSEASTHT